MIAAATHPRFKLTLRQNKELEEKKNGNWQSAQYDSFPTHEREEIEPTSEVEDPD